MEQRDGYIQIAIKEGQAYCHIFPPKEGGKALSPTEAAYYLTSEGFIAPDPRLLSSAISSPGGGNIALGPCKYPFLSGTMSVSLSETRMEAICRFYPPSLGGSFMNAADIRETLKKEGVLYGISDEAIEDFLRSPVYCTDICLARGDAPVPGHDAGITYTFNTNPSLRPRLLEDGSVDYHDLSILNEVKKGDLLATLTPMDRGRAGSDVTGRKLDPPSVKNARLEYGRDIRLSDDRTEIFSEVTGHVTLLGGKVFVSATYDIPSDVDNSTGDVDFDGNVHVHGSVRSGFTVTCTGDIQVDGVVENALLTAGGQIVVKHGVHGMGKGMLEAKGNIITKFIENARVFSGGYVEAGSIINSEVSATGDIHVEERKGFISGGVIRSGGSVSAQTIGSRMGSETRLEVGLDPKAKSHYQALLSETDNAKEVIKKTGPILKSYKDRIKKGMKLDAKNAAYLKKVAAASKEAAKTLSQNEEELTSLKKRMAMGTHARVSFAKDIFPGVTVVMQGAQKTIKKQLSHSYLSVDEGEVRASVM